MRQFMTALTLFGTVVALMLPVTSAQAQATRTWVSGVGDDANPCSRTAPCKTFAGAISKTAVNGEINCLDPGGFGAVTITKSISIDCHETVGGLLVAGTNGILINFDAFAGTDTRKNVYLRNLTINGSNTGLNGVRIIGAANSANSGVTVEDCLVENFFGAPGRGISDERSGGGKLFVNNSTFLNLGNSGIVMVPGNGAVAGARLDGTINNVRVFNTQGDGVALGSNIRASISRSVFSGNTVAGVLVEGPLAGSEVNINDSVIEGNGTGLTVNAGGTMRISTSTVAFNTTQASGTVLSFTNNRFSSNGAGGVISPIGGPTSDSGQQ